jgi:Tfp pilus assembly protein PilN
VRAVNLIPLEDRRGDHAPLRAGAASYAIVGVLALALIGVVLVVLAGNSARQSESELASLQARKAVADTAAADLAPYGEFASLTQSRDETVASLAQSRFDWQRVLNEFALVIPRRVTIENLTGTATTGVSVGTSDAGPTDASITGPQLQISGCAPGQNGVARFLAALRDIDGVTRVGMESSQLGDESAAAPGATSSAAASGAEGSCQTGPQVAAFHVTVAFDAVPAAPVAAAGTVPATPAATTTPEAGTTTPATTADNSGIAATQATEQGAKDSAQKQISDAKDGAAAVGVGG